MAVFDDIKLGLEQAIDYEKGKRSAKVTKMEILPLETFTSADIKAIRAGAGMTQSLFAQYLGVSVKTVEAWESGRDHPQGPARRMLALTRNDPQFPVASGILVR